MLGIENREVEQKCNGCGHKGPLKTFIKTGRAAEKLGHSRFARIYECPKCKSADFEEVK